MRLLLLIMACAVLFTANSFSQAPVFTPCPGNIIVNSPANGCATAVNYYISTSASPVTYTHTFTGATVNTDTTGTGSGSTFNRGFTTVTVTAKNASFSTKCTFTVEVKDVTAPSITCPPWINIPNTPGLCTGSASLTPPAVTDNCPINPGNSLDFDGVNNFHDYAKRSSLEGFTTDSGFTVEGWINFNSLGVWNSFAAYSRAHIPAPFDIYFEPGGGILRFFYGNGGGFSWLHAQVNVEVGKWYHFAVVYNPQGNYPTGNYVAIYKNGVEISKSINERPAIIHPEADFRIGSRQNLETKTDGKIDELRIWNKPRTQAEIAANMNSELNAQADLIALYHFNQGIAGGTNTMVDSAIDASGFGNHVKLTNFGLNDSRSNWAGGAFGSITNNAPRVASALNFDGVNDYVGGTNPALPNGTSPFTVETWIKPGNGQGNRCIFEWGTISTNMRSSLYYINQRIYFSGIGNDLIGTTIFPPGSWYHFAMTYDGTNLKLFVNGILEASKTTALGTTGQNYRVGADLSGTGPFNGAIDEIRVWDVARTQAQIQQSMNSELNAQSNLITLFHFNQGVSNGINTGIITVTDASGKNQNGTLINFALGGTTSNWVGGYMPNNAPTSFPIGSTTVTWNATDAAGNSTSCNQVITVFDNEMPVITTNGDTVVNSNTGICGATVAVSATAADNCSVGAPTGLRSDGLALNAIYPVGITTITWKVTDANGNTATRNQSVTVNPPGTNVDAPEINVKGTNAADIADGSTIPAVNNNTQFGTINVGQGSAQSFTIQNTGAFNLTLNAGSISFKGVDAASFLLSGITLPMTITPGSSTTFTVSFLPLSAGSKKAFVNIINNDCDEAVYDFAIGGTALIAIAPVINCSPDTTILNRPGLCTAVVNLFQPNNPNSIVGNALGFDGVNDYSVNTSPNGLNFNTNNEITAEAWIYFVPGQWDFWLSLKLGENIKYRFGSTPVGNVVWDMGQHWDHIFPGYTLPNNTWTHIAFVGKTIGSTIHSQVFINGELLTTFNETTTTLPPANIIYVGTGEQPLVHNFNGKLDEVRLWNIARTQAQIVASMKTELIAQDGLVALYHFNEGIAGGSNIGLANSSPDASGMGNNLTLYNFAKTGTNSNWVAGQSLTTGMTITNNAPATYPIGNTTVTWTAIDEGGNTANCIQTVTVVAPTGTQVKTHSNIIIADGDNTPSLTDSTDFGMAGTSPYSVLRNYTIQNLSGVPLVIGAIHFTGADASQFTVHNISLPDTVNANESTGFSIALEAQTTGIKNATVNITTNNCSLLNYDFAVTGMAVQSKTDSFTTSSGTFTPKPGVTHITVEAWGAGGSNGGAENPNGGGGGAYFKSKLLPVSFGTNFPLTVGQHSSSPSRNSTFNSLITANGANTNSGGSAISGPNIAVSYSGGNGGTKDYVLTYQQSFAGGGGGGAGGASGEGKNGENSICYICPGNGGNAGMGGGNGGNGGGKTPAGIVYAGSNGSFPGGGAGSYGAATGANGLVRITYNCPGGGRIRNEHSVTYPPQLVPDSIFNEEAVIPTTQNGLVYRWQQNTNPLNLEPNPATWVEAKTPTNNLSYRFDKDSIFQTTWYRRVSNSCNGDSISNVVKINVVNPRDGTIEGRVLNKNGIPVSGIKIYVKKVADLPGSPATYIDSSTTAISGRYSVQGIYYGDPKEGNNKGTVKTKFIITPYKIKHGFNPSSLEGELSNTNWTIENVDFTDTTVFAITGRTYQECLGCLNSANLPDTIISGVDSVTLFVKDTFNTHSGFIDPPGENGRYSVTVPDPGSYKIEPRFKNHKFSPVSKSVTVEGDVENIDFKDTTNYTIYGKLTAGCNDYIGTAVLEFSDILPNAANGTPRIEFRKRVTTELGTGVFSITLPARKYKVSIISFAKKEGGDVEEVDLKPFFQYKIPPNSLIKDITMGNDSLFLVYNRPPTLVIGGLDPLVCNNVSLPFAIVQQGIDKDITVKAFQGPASKKCPAIDDSLTINTNIQTEGENEALKFKTDSGFVIVKLTGGTPNIVAPHFKIFNIDFTDVNGENTQLTRNVVVTGLKSNIGSFATVSPQIPLMVLHDPPGDGSFSFWEKSITNETAMRFYAALDTSATAWAEIKLGIKKQVGIGVSTTIKAWGKVRGDYTVDTKTNNASEEIVRITTTETFSTSNSETEVGDQGDVFIGVALNLLHAVSNELAFNPDSCILRVSKKLMQAQNGFATEYIYTEGYIRNSLLNTLRSFRDNPTNTVAEKDSADNQIKVWEQVLANNDANKKRAAFDKNISFVGAAGPISSTTTISSSKSNTIEFDMLIDTSIAAEAGFEYGGSGLKGGVKWKFKSETGHSTTNTAMNSTTIGYTLDDNDGGLKGGDIYSVNVKKDPVYNTPVFEIVAATTSCPYEPGTQPRDEMQLTVPEPIKTNIAPNDEGEFILKLSNTSQSEEQRTYHVSFVPSSNPNGAEIKIGGILYVGVPIPYTIDYQGTVDILVKVKRGASNIFSYKNLQFMVTPACDGSIVKTAEISADFTATCSPIELSQPENNWLNTKEDNNILPVLFKGYMPLGNTTSVTLEYQKAGSNNWTTGFTMQAASINNSVNGTQANWNIHTLEEGAYNLRMNLNCPNGVVYSTRSSGIIDRVSPKTLGKPEPTDDNWVRGDQIAIQYDELLDCSGVTPEDVVVTRLSNKQTIPANVGCFQNKIVIVPLADISGWKGDSIRVSVNNISDQYGNGKTVPDTWRFIVGNTVPATGPNALTLSSSGAPGGFAGGKALLSGPSVMEDAGIPIKFAFELPANAANDMLINYTISGNAVFGKDYNIDYSQPQNLATVFNGASGSLTLKKDTKKIELSIIPIPNQQFEPDKTITITLAEGGDYDLGATVTATGIILNDDTPKVYVFTGSGNYNVPANWDNNIVPPSQILVGDEVVIDPPEGGECILNVPVTVLPGAKFTVMPGKVLKIGSNLQVKKKL